MEDTKKCPKCGKSYTGKPAVSRVDDSEICPECGLLEALDAAGVDEDTKAETLKLVRESLKKTKA